MIAVVGGGIAGIAVTRALALAGLEPALFDEGDAVGGGASAVPVAVLNPYRGKRGVPLPDDLAGLHRFAAIAAELAPKETGWHPVGVLRIADTAQRAEMWRDLEGVRTLGAADVAGVAGVDLAAPFGGFFFAQGGYADTRVFRTAVLEHARLHSARVHLGERVLEVVPEDEHFRIATPRGEHTARAVVSCTGATAAAWAPCTDLRRVDGEILEWRRTELRAPPSGGAEPVLIARCLLIRSSESVWVGGVHAGSNGDPGEAATMLRSAGQALWPALAAAEPCGSFRAMRAATPSNAPRVRRIAPRVWAIEALAGRGYLRAFDLAERLTAEIARELASQ